jgi:hypothetical protein
MDDNETYYLDKTYFLFMIKLKNVKPLIKTTFRQQFLNIHCLAYEPFRKSLQMRIS